MSGSIASRFQGRFGYGPQLGAGQYGPQMPGVSMPGQTGTAAPQPAAPAQQTATPVSAGAAPQPSNPDPNGDGPTGNANTYGADSFGANPGTLGGGLSGWGVSTYGNLGSVLGGLAGAAMGVPGVGMAAGALGSLADAREANGMLADFGLAPSISDTQAALSSGTMGLFGRSTDAQFGDVLGLPAPGTVFGLPGHELDLPGASLADTPDEVGSYLDTMQPEADMPMAAVDPGSYGGFGGPDGGVSGSGPGGGGDFGDHGDMGDPGGGADAAYMAGGYTGAGADGAVQPAQRAGTVHEGEVVIPAHQVARYGLPMLMQLVHGGMQPSRLSAMMRGD